jgi:hypothetical protein
VAQRHNQQTHVRSEKPLYSAIALNYLKPTQQKPAQSGLFNISNEVGAFNAKLPEHTAVT